MKLSIISSDPVQSHVLLRLADRAGWSVSQGLSLEDVGHVPAQVDAVVVDIERLDAAIRRDLRALAGRVGRERVFLIAEPVRDVLPTPAELGVQYVATKPLDLADFIRLVGASVPVRSSPFTRNPLAGRPRTHQHHGMLPPSESGRREVTSPWQPPAQQRN